MYDPRKIIEQIRPDVERDLNRMRTKADHTAVCIGIIFVGFFLFFLFISEPPPPLFSIFYLVLGIVAYFGLRDQFLKVLNPVVEERLRRLDREPETAQELARRAEIFAEYDQPDAAVVDYRDAIQWAPDDPSIRFDYAALLWKLGRSEEALKFLGELTPVRSDFQAAAYFLRAGILVVSDPSRAEKYFNRAIKIDPDSVEFRLGRAEFFLNADRFDETEADLKEVSILLRNIGLADSAELCRLRGTLQMKRGNAAAAVKDFSRAIRVDPGNAPQYFRLRAEAYLALGNPRQAQIDRQYAEEE